MMDAQPKFDEFGLLPAVVQDATTGQVLMLAYMNREAYELTLRDRRNAFLVTQPQRIVAQRRDLGEYPARGGNGPGLRR